ncbi:HvfC/BufC family peptide modification chaperone [Arhodomonas sp. AD133]|uniref:HvfC/BufC family peptide modification chaperone n=1 Tax=Arhodomonas sp. AD133 TaxID=3415009 RepID=UPI003EB78073
MPDPSLSQVQHWFRHLLTERGSLGEKLRETAHHQGLTADAVIRHDKGSSPYTRLNIYATGYVMRLVESLSNEYPLLYRFMGEEVFTTFAKAYIVTRPSRTWSLFELGRGFASFLDASKPQWPAAPEERALIELPAQIATFERARTEALLARGLEDAPSATIETLDPLRPLLGDLQIVTPPCLKLCRLAYPIPAMAVQWEQDEEADIPPAGDYPVAVSRVDYQLRVLTLEAWQYDLLLACRQPTSVVEALPPLGPSSGQVDRFAHVLAWLPLAFENGLLTPPPRQSATDSLDPARP